MGDIFEGKSVLITGGTGSFGNFVVPELLKFNVREVVVFSRDEEKQLEMQRNFSDSRLKFVIGDVRDKERVLECVRSDYVYHAAALKVIPTCEEFPKEVVKTNLLGTMHIRDACIKNGVEKAILISTDKAVKPVNTYGMTKALAERVWLDLDNPSMTKLSVVRYGNVLGSRGSVVPYFKDLIKQGKPLPITHSSMSRFLLTLKQAIDLVFYGTKIMNGGEIFIPKNPACRVVDLAKALAGENYQLEHVGIRPGEKIAEVLISEEETRRTEERDGCFVIHPFGRIPPIEGKGEFTSESSVQLHGKKIILLLKEANLL